MQTDTVKVGLAWLHVQGLSRILLWCTCRIHGYCYRFFKFPISRAGPHTETAHPEVAATSGDALSAQTHFSRAWEGGYSASRTYRQPECLSDLIVAQRREKIRAGPVAARQRGGGPRKWIHALQNRASATREDCIRISTRLRGPNSHLPLLPQLAILDDLKRGHGVCEVARTYRVDRKVVQRLKKFGPGNRRWQLPPEFQLLTIGSRWAAR